MSGTGPVVGEAIASHPGIDAVSFTGSARAGKRVAELASQTVKRVTLELGGKSANVILPDADLGTAVKVGVAKAFINSGQTCTALTRMLVPADSYDEAVSAAPSRPPGATPSATRWPREPGSARSSRPPSATGSGASSSAVCPMEPPLATGGAEPRPEGMPSGYFVQPTVFSNVRPDMTIAQEEIFGPVLSVIGYGSEDEAVEIANGTRYGLAAAVWSADPDRAAAEGRRLRAGQVEINGGAFNPVAPFGGFGESGYGRELGVHGMEEFLEVKSLQF